MTKLVIAILHNSCCIHERTESEEPFCFSFDFQKDVIFFQTYITPKSFIVAYRINKPFHF